MQKWSYHTKPIVLGLGMFLFFGLIFASEASARSAKSKWTIEAGGRTIGGPGIATVNPNDTLNVLELPSGQARPVCVTGHNRGHGKANISVGGETEGSPMNVTIETNQTRSVCGEGTLITISCEVAGCRVIWRVDDLR